MELWTLKDRCRTLPLFLPRSTTSLTCPFTVFVFVWDTNEGLTFTCDYLRNVANSAVQRTDASFLNKWVFSFPTHPICGGSKDWDTLQSVPCSFYCFAVVVGRFMCECLVLMSSYCSHFTFGCGLAAVCPLLCLFFLRKSALSALMDTEASVPGLIEAGVWGVPTLEYVSSIIAPKHVLSVTTYQKSD